jgi:hypothetical protein
LHSRWQIVLGKTSEQLPKLLATLGEIDAFFHDSDHSYDNMTFEFGTAWTFLRHEGLLLADDTDENESFSDFSMARGTKVVLFPSASANKRYGIAACKKTHEFIRANGGNLKPDIAFQNLSKDVREGDRRCR